MMTLGLFLLSLAGCFYAYAGYPLILLLRARLRPAPVRRDRSRPPPSVSVIVAAYNEERIIEGKIRNTLALDYPQERLELIIASDGSTDATEAIVEASGDDRVRLLRLARAGKLNALNHAALAASGDVLLFTDANVLLDREAVERLVRNFADPAVGGVCGVKRQFATTDGDTTAHGEGLYARYDRWVTHLESRGGSLYAADGCMYAIRRECFVPVRDFWQADDIAISARVVLGGRRLIHEPEAICREEAPAEGLAELRRKVRVANHTMRAVLHLRGELPRAGFYALQLVSHKLARYLVPVWLIALLVSNSLLAGRSGVFAALLAAQLAFHGLALAGWTLRASPAGRARLFSVPYYFTLVNAAALLGLVNVLRGQRHVTWSPRAGMESGQA
jgi:cellulose synthase/poly-beta-1,6-N-acetylglucosamine synthase-like glycosyltransferase